MLLPTFLSISFLFLLPSSHSTQHFREVFSWNEIDYTFYSDNARQVQINDGRFILGNSVPISLEIDTKTDRVFISMPRFKPGNAASLAVVSKSKNSRGQYLLTPYPEWRYHRQGDCEGITSVFRTYIDECRRLWVVDTGKSGGSIEAAAGVNSVCPAKLMIFDLDTNRLIKRYEFPEEIIKPETVLVSIAVDVRDTANKCENTFAYVADVSGFMILVYDMYNEDSWKVQSNEMFPYPPWGVFNIAGRSFDLMDGVLALALSPKEPHKDRTLYFHSLSSNVESWVSTHVLRNKSNFEGNDNKAKREFMVSEGHREGQAASMAMDENGVLFFSVLPKLSVNCWNTRKPYQLENIVQLDVDREAFQFIAGVKVKKDKQGVPELWILSSRFQRHMTGGVDANDVNYRVMKAPIAKIVKGTSCEVIRRPGGPSTPPPRPGRPGRPGSGAGYSPSGHSAAITYPDVQEEQTSQRPTQGQNYGK